MTGGKNVKENVEKQRKNRYNVIDMDTNRNPMVKVPKEPDHWGFCAHIRKLT